MNKSELEPEILRAFPEKQQSNLRRRTFRDHLISIGSGVGIVAVVGAIALGINSGTEYSHSQVAAGGGYDIESIPGTRNYRITITQTSYYERVISNVIQDVSRRENCDRILLTTLNATNSLSAVPLCETPRG